MPDNDVRYTHVCHFQVLQIRVQFLLYMNRTGGFVHSAKSSNTKIFFATVALSVREIIFRTLDQYTIIHTSQ